MNPTANRFAKPSYQELLSGVLPALHFKANLLNAFLLHSSEGMEHRDAILTWDQLLLRQHHYVRLVELVYGAQRVFLERWRSR